MNILASYKWLGEYVDLAGMTPEEVASRVSMASCGIERLYPQGLELGGIVVGKTRAVEKHPNADALKLVSVDVGGDKPLSIVCGGSNVVENQWVVVARIGSRVRWHGEGDLVELKPVAIRGVASEGMICAANEIGLFDAFPHGEKEILDLEAAGLVDLKPGKPLAELLELEGDILMDTEITTNRPDCLGMVGLAREVATVLNRPFTWKPSKPLRSKAKSMLQVHVEKHTLCPRYTAVRIDNITIGPSPWWIKRRLLANGIRPINNVVDITNYVMIELGHPMHVFDADKIEGDMIRVRQAHADESIAALDGVTYELAESMLVIADATKPIAVAGIMGGEHSSVGSGTRSIVFEAAAFDPVSVRRTSRALHLQTDAQLRFEKGLSTEAAPIALARAVELCLTLAGGAVASPVLDTAAKAYAPETFSVTFAEVNALIGITIPPADVVRILKHLGFTVQKTAKGVKAQTPWWRDHDIEAGRDLIEEVARIYGYINIPPVFPIGLPARPVSKELQWERTLRTIAAATGFTETFTYSFTSGDVLKRAGYDASRMLRVQNPLSQEFEFMRTTLLPSMLQVIQDNKDKRDTLRLFELAHVYYPKQNDLPTEQTEFAAAVFSKDEQPWRIMKGFAEHVFNELGIQGIVWTPLTTDPFWHPGRSMLAFVGDHLLATLGEINPEIAERFGVTRDIGRIAMMDMPLETVTRWATASNVYESLTRFPDVERDLALVVDRDVTAAMIKEELAHGSYGATLRSVEWFDTYRGKGVPEGKKSVAFHFTFRDAERTLASEDVDKWMNEAKQRLADRFGAEQRG